ncbi:nifR3-like protein [Rickettsia sibirica 246]|uniref:NifR3-like protein n=1 Tax=Rickettsia sibirica (strain ATCC VR-151 / 246) TaxID=272951 RepID=Q7PAB8_RICS2|nr:nifR3-like protein [Rickettsia sibirica 246]
MRDEQLAAKIFEATVEAVKLPVTVKMRMGWDDNTKNAPTLAKIAESSGVQMRLPFMVELDASFIPVMSIGILYDQLKNR